MVIINTIYGNTNARFCLFTSEMKSQYLFEKNVYQIVQKAADLLPHYVKSKDILHFSCFLL